MAARIAAAAAQSGAARARSPVADAGIVVISVFKVRPS
jgi:hypothetical protein